MRKKHVLTILFFSLCMACRDKQISLIPEQDPYRVYPANFVQHVLLENMVSESKTESVDNSFLIKEMEERFGDRLIVVNLHKQDWLETPFSNELADQLGGLINYPRAAFNRTPAISAVEGDDWLTWLRPVNWEFTLQQALAQKAQISLAVQTSIKGEEGSVKLYLAHEGQLADDMRIGLYMVEDNVKSIFQQGSNHNFLHQHVMKNALTDIEGDTISFSADAFEKQIDSREYNNIDLKFYKLPQTYLVAYVFHFDKDRRKIRIYNAIKVKFGANKFWNQ